MSALIAALRMLFAFALVLGPSLRPPSEPAFDLGPISPPPVATRELAPLKGQALRISQVYSGGNSSCSDHPCDFVELFNASPDPVTLSGGSIQYRKPTLSYWTVATLGTITVPGYGYLLVSATKTPWLQPDVSQPLSLNTSPGAVALVNMTKQIAGPKDPAIIDLVGYGVTSDSEGTSTPDLGLDTAAWRKDGGCTDTDNNADDFVIAAPAARNSHSPTHSCNEKAPEVISTSPAGGATGVTRDASVTVTFSEPVAVSGNWLEIACDLSGTRSVADAAVAGDSVTFTINPNIDFVGDDDCKMTIYAAKVSDKDTGDPPDTLQSDYIVHFKTVPGACGEPAYRIADIQGAGDVSPAAGQLRTVEAVVTGDYQGTAGLSGFFVQEEPAEADDDAQTSEALFVKESVATPTDVLPGTRVRVTGAVSEDASLTAMTNVSRVVNCGPQSLPAPASLLLPVPASSGWEPYEGMLVQFQQQLVVWDSSELGTQGRLRLGVGDVPRAYTQAHAPDPAGFAEWEQDLTARTILLDDGSDTLQPDPIAYPSPGLTAANTVRIGDTVDAGLEGILDLRNGSIAIQPTSDPVISKLNPRTAAPARAGGNLRVVFMSLNDYFKVAGATAGTRGAGSSEEFDRQRTKLISALVDLDADIIGVSKVANDGYGPASSLVDLVNGMNARSGANRYSFVDASAVGSGSDVVAVGLIYRSSAAAPAGQPAILQTGAFVQDASSLLHRAPIAQAFEERTWGERFVVVVTEWHGRGDCPADGPNADDGDGQACWNVARTAAAQDMAAWLTTDPTDSGDAGILILGELNAFPAEDPIRSLAANSYADLMAQFVGPNALTSLPASHGGTTDYALASPDLALQVLGAHIWNVAADEPPAIDYHLDGKSAAQKNSLYAPDAYRSSDHNPLAVDLSLLPDFSDLSGSYGTAWHTGQGEWRLGESWGGEDDGVLPNVGSWNDGQGEITVTVRGPADQAACLYAWLDYGDGEVLPGVVEEPDGKWDSGEEVITALSLAPGSNQPVTFPLPPGSIKNGASLNMRVRLTPAPPTGCALGRAVAVSAAVGPTGRADGGEVEDHVIQLAPLAVDLGSLAANANGSEVRISWETLSEEDVAGFNLHRMSPPDDVWRKINLTAIPSQTPGAGQGNHYEWLDCAVQAGVTYAYRLEEVTLDGASAFYGPVTVTPGIPTLVGMSELRGVRVQSPLPVAAVIGLGLLAAIVRRSRRPR